VRAAQETADDGGVASRRLADEADRAAAAERARRERENAERRAAEELRKERDDEERRALAERQLRESIELERAEAERRAAQKAAKPSLSWMQRLLGRPPKEPEPEPEPGFVLDRITRDFGAYANGEAHSEDVDSSEEVEQPRAS
jgi:hypothetical protein